MAGNIAILDGAKTLDLRDESAVKGFLGKVEEHAKSMHQKVQDQERTIAEKSAAIEKMADDIRTIRQRQAELDAADALQPADERHAALCRFIDTDGKVFLRGAGFEGKSTNVRRSRETGLLTTRPINDLHKQLIDDAEALYITATVRHGSDAFDARGNYRPSVIRTLGTAYDRLQATWKAMPKAVKKAWDDQSGSGGDFIPLPLLATPVWQVEEFDPDGVLGMFEEMPLTSASVELPVGTAYPVPYKGGGNSGDNPAALAKSSVGTSKLTLSLASMYAMVLVHEDASADSIVAAVPFIRNAIAMSMTVGERYAIFNGDTAATHQDDIANWDLRGMFGAVDAGSIHYLKTMLGFRAIALDDSNGVDRSTFSRATLAADINAVGGPRGNPVDVPVITSPESYLSVFVNLDGVVSTNDYGSRDPIAKGEVGHIFGHPIIATDAMPADLNTSGLYDNATKTKSGAVIMNRRMFRRLSRAGESITLAMQPDITIEGTYLRAKKRLGLKDLTKSGDKGVRYLYNLSK